MYKWLSGKAESPFERGSRGFTLVELMIVIAIIAILMLVLVPRIGVLRQKSKEAGIKANFLMVEGIARNEIENYTTTNVDKLVEKIISDIDAPATVDQIRNPITGATGTATTLAASGPAVDGGAVIAAIDATPPTKGGVDPILDDVQITKAGMIGFGAYSVDNRINVRMVGYDETGKLIESLDKTISQ